MPVGDRSSLQVTVNPSGTSESGHDALLRNLKIDDGLVVNVDSRLAVTGPTWMSRGSEAAVENLGTETRHPR